MKHGRVTFKHVFIEDLRNLAKYVWYAVFKMLSCNTTLTPAIAKDAFT